MIVWYLRLLRYKSSDGTRFVILIIIYITCIANRVPLDRCPNGTAAKLFADGKCQSFIN